jgi:predicted MFS family arabinose efflux permease
MTRQATSFLQVFLLWGAGLGAAAQYGKVSVIYDLLPGVYPEADLALGFLVSLVGMVGIIFGVVAGVLVARVGLRRALLWALWFGAGLSVLQALLPPLPIMLMLRALEGVSHLAIVVATPTLIAQLSAPRHLGLTLTLWSTFFGVSYTMLVWLGLPLVAWLGVPALFLAHAVWLAVFALILAPRLDPLRPEDASPVMRVRDAISVHRRVYTSAFLSAPALGWLFYTFCYLSLLTLIPPFIAEGQRALVLGAMPLVSIVVSMSLGVVLLRWVSAIQLVMAGFVLVVVSLVWLLGVPGGAAACFALSGALGLVQGASFAAVPQLNSGATERAQANGAMAQMGNIGNTLGTPVLALILSGAGYSGMILTALVVCVGGFVVHLVLAQRRRTAPIPPTG